MASQRSVTPIALRREEVSALLGLSSATVQRLIQRGEFPAPRKLGERSVAWSRAEVEQWFAARPASDILPPPSSAAGTAHAPR